jgi:hypothetical protein
MMKKTIWKISKKEKGQTWNKIKANDISLFYDKIEVRTGAYYLYTDNSISAILYRRNNEIKGVI